MIEIFPNYQENKKILAETTPFQTKRLLLRPVTMADAKDLFEYTSDEENTRFIFPPTHSLEEQEKEIQSYFLDDPTGKFGVELLEDHKLIGTIDLRLRSAQPTAEIGYAFNKCYWHHGYATEATRAIITLAFDKLHLIRVEAFHHSKNSASGKVMQRIGMEHEGHLRHNAVHRGKIIDQELYAIINSKF